MPDHSEYNIQINSGQTITNNCMDYLNMRPEIPVGDLSGERWRFHSTARFVAAREADLRDNNLDNIDALEINAAGSALIDTTFFDLAREPKEKAIDIINDAQGLSNEFFGVVTDRAKIDPGMLDDEQFYRAACLLAATGFIRPQPRGRALGLRGKIRSATSYTLVQAHRHLTGKLAEYGRGNHGPEVGSLFRSRAELLVNTALMRKEEDYEPIEETAIVVPALARQFNSFHVGTPNNKWSSSVWRLNNAAVRASRISIATPPDAKLVVKHAGSEQDAARYDPSIKYVSLVNDVIHTDDEGRIGEIVRALRFEANRSRKDLLAAKRDELDFITRNARDAAGW